MKRSLGLNPAGIGRFFLYHGEKLGLAAVGLVALFLIWGSIVAVRSESVPAERAPAKLQDLARAAEGNIDQATKPPADRIPDRRPLPARVAAWRPQQVSIAPAPAAPALLDRPVSGETSKRPRPSVFPIEDLQAVAGLAVLPDPAAGFNEGGFAPPGMMPPGPGNDPRRPADRRDRDRGGRDRRDRDRRGRGRDEESASEGSLYGLGGPMQPGFEGRGEFAAEPQQPGKVTPFVVVTGLIPAAKQIAEYESRFAEAALRDPQRDYPRWGVYLVERARVVPNGSLKWERREVTNVARSGPGGEGRMPMGPMMEPGMGRPGGFGPGLDAAAPLAPETLPQSFLLLPQETEIGYAAAVPERIDRPWGGTVLHPWFIPRLEKLLRGEFDEEAGQAAPQQATLADLLDRPDDFRDQRLLLDQVVLEARPRRQQMGLYLFGVRSADGSRTVSPELTGREDSPVFAAAGGFVDKLAVAGITSEARPCRLEVRIERMGRTPVARILAIVLLDDSGAPIDTYQDPAPLPIFAEGGMGMADGGRMGPEFAGGMDLAEYRLFRFVDTDVEPGEQYRYRVKFALRNPNAGLAARYLENPADTREEFLVSEYSPETPPVRVPETNRLAIRTIPREVAQSMKIRGDDYEVMVLAAAEDNGNFSLRSVVAEPGDFANVDTSRNTRGNTRFYGESVVTDRMLLDVRGTQEARADRRGPEPPPPLEMLFLRADGSFELVSAADSELDLVKYGNTLFKPGTELPADGKPDPRDQDARGRRR